MYRVCRDVVFQYYISYNHLHDSGKLGEVSIDFRAGAYRAYFFMILLECYVCIF